MRHGRAAAAIWLLVVAFTVEVALVIFWKVPLPMLALYHAGAFSLATFATFVWDKMRAVRGGERVSEATLLLLAVLGGAPGALAAMLAVRHKTQRPLFWIVVCGALFVQVTLVGWLFISRS